MSKSKDRVRGYREGSEDWNAEYNMLLDDGVTCAECAHVTRCTGMFGQKETDTKCQFYPNRFARPAKMEPCSFCEPVKTCPRPCGG